MVAAFFKCAYDRASVLRRILPVSIIGVIEVIQLLQIVIHRF